MPAYKKVEDTEGHHVADEERPPEYQAPPTINEAMVTNSEPTPVTDPTDATKVATVAVSNETESGNSDTAATAATAVDAS